MFKIYKIFLFILSLFAISCSSIETKRENGIRYAQNGDWERGIENLEAYVSENIKKFPSAISIFENPAIKSELDQSEYKKFSEAVFYLLSCYLGIAGFDWFEIGDKILEVKDVDTSQKEGKVKVAEKIMEIFGGEENKKKIFYLYKSIRLAERFLYGQENPPQASNIFPDISKIIEKDGETFYESVRFIKSIEYTYGKTLVWLSVIESVELRQIQYYLEKNKGKTPFPPSYCCLFKGWDKKQSEYPYLLITKNIDQLLEDVSDGIEQINYGVAVEDKPIDFSDFSTRYGEVIQDLRGDFYENIDRSCSKWSNRLTETINKLVEINISKILKDFQYFSTYTVKADIGKESGIWICPEDPGIYKEFSYDIMCSFKNDEEINRIYNKYSDKITKEIIPGYSDRITFQIFFEVPRPGDIPIYMDCQKQEKDSFQLNKTITINIIIKNIYTVDESKGIIDEVCSSGSFKDLSNLKLFNEFLIANIEDKGKRALEDILNGRDDPKMCSLE
ncbi:MAG: hypothetical protein NZ927_04625 [Candidatus Calescibacterium sp.]|nr:hypothetical protein [Candidatus Calescibacterium sp.]